jgi:Flp pilus assembly protein TadD
MGKASVLAEYSKDQEASRKVLLKVLRLYPDHPPALAGLAVVLARLGQRDAAINRIEAALRCDPSGEIRYQAACVHALTGEVPTALRYLKAAVADRYGLEFLDKDRDLMALRKRDEFTELVRAAKALRGG